MNAPAQDDPFIGRNILGGQFQIIQKIGAGGMGTVYKASQPAMNRLVAVKILHPKLTARKDLASRFRREARAMSHLTHPNTVKVLLYGELEDGSLYIVMEYLDGKNVNQTLRREGPLPLDRAVNILVQVCGALHEAHTQGIIHRDLKPENIFLTSVGEMKDFAKVLDFGLAKVTERELRPGSIMLTQEGMVFGTPEFMSPEQAQGKVLDARSDIYSLAVILYEMVTGKLPFEAKTAMEHIQHHVTKPPLPVDKRVPGRTFVPTFWPVLAKALEKRVDARYATAIDFANALRPFAAPGQSFPGMAPQPVAPPAPGSAPVLPYSPQAAPGGAANGGPNAQLGNAGARPQAQRPLAPTMAMSASPHAIVGVQAAGGGAPVIPAAPARSELPTAPARGSNVEMTKGLLVGIIVVTLVLGMIITIATLVLLRGAG